MDIVNVSIWLCIIFLVIRRYLKRNHQHWAKMKMAHDPPHFLFGNVIAFYTMKKTGFQIVQDLYAKYRGERFIGMYNATQIGLVVTQPEDIKRVLVTDFQHFQDRLSFKVEEWEPLNKNLFNVGYEHWKPMRHKVSPAFTTGKLKNMVPLMVEVGDHFSKQLNEMAEKEEEAEFRDVMAGFTADVIGSCGFGLNMNSINDVDAPFKKMGIKIFQFTPIKVIKLVIKQLFPGIFQFFKISIQDSKEEEFFMNVVKDVVEQRVRTKAKRNDFVDLMLELREREGEEEINDEFIAAQCFIFFLAGFETSSTLMSYVLHELAIHPDIQQKVYEEIETILSKQDGKISYEIISELKYLDMVVNEVERMYPALGNITRHCTSPYTFPDSQIKVEKGNFVLVPTMALHYDPKYYPDPERFDPERFRSGEKNDRDPMVYLPFGEGPRNCVGLRMGKIQSVIGLITVLKDFVVEPCTKTTPKIVFNPTSFVTTSKNGLWLKIRKRRKN